MHLTHKEIWTAVHGMVLGAGFLLAFPAVFFGLWGFRSQWLTHEGAGRRLRWLVVGSWAIAILGWLAVIVGTYMIYPWYRARPPATASPSSLAEYPRSLLLSKPATAEWHNFGMEWKEHLAWLSPILATAVAYVITRHGKQLLKDAHLRRALLVLFAAAFFCAGVAGVFGALINKAAPTR